MGAKAKTIKMILYDGTLNGVMNISDSAWESGKMYSAPRESISDLVSQEDCKKYGVYLLLSENNVYVGQAIDLERRTKQHLTDKDWWTQVILMTTKNDSFNASDIDYLESRLIDLASNLGTSDSNNKKKGNRQKVDEFRQVELEQYLDEALFLLELIGVRVFKNKFNKNGRKKTTPVIVGSTNIERTGCKNNKPLLPSMDLKPGVFVKTAIKNLLASGFVFSNEQISIFSTSEGSKQFTTRNLPMLWILKDGKTRADCEEKIRDRYWKEEFQAGTIRFLMYSQWYENPKKGATKENFIEWYNTL